MGIFSSAIQFMSGEYINLDSPDIIRLDATSASKGNQTKYYDIVNKNILSVNLSIKVNYGKIIW